MLLHNFKYSFLLSVRNKAQIFWSLIFAVILGTLFYSTFGNAYEYDLIDTIKVVCCIEDKELDTAFRMSVEQMKIDDDKKLLEVTYITSFEEAKEELTQDKYVGLFYSEKGELKLMVKNNGISESVLSSVVSGFHQNSQIVKAVAEKNEAALMDVILKLAEEGGNNNVERKLSDANMSPFLIYFYNLIAMSCMFASFAVLDVVERSQANLSAIGARKNLAENNVVACRLTELLAHVLVMFVLSTLSFVYLCIIGVDFGDKIPAIILTIFIGDIMGSALGFLIGSIPNLNSNAKNGICTGVSLALCFFSGLMIADLRAVIETNCPILNDINPAAMICDSLYALNVYDTYNRFFGNILSMLVVSVVFIVGGILLGGKKSYESL